ncbi:MAG: fibronectin type III domain-containing protein [Psychroflexus halocasei]
MKKNILNQISIQVNLIIFLSLVFVISAKSQDMTQLISGPKGVVIFGESLGYFSQKDDEVVMPSSNEKVNIYKSDQGQDKFKKIGEFKFPESAQEFNDQLNQKTREAFSKHFKTQDVNLVYQRIRTHGLDTLGFAYLLPEVRQAIGLIFIDSSWEKGDKVDYKFEKVKADGQTEVIENISVNGSYQKYNHHFKIKDYWMSDSLVGVTFSAISKGKIPTYAHLMSYHSADKKFIKTDTTFVVGQTSDTLSAYFNKKIQPMEQVVLYMRTYDLAGNYGPTSDTLYTMNVNKSKIAGMKNLKVTDTIDGLLMQWEQLPKTKVYSGIQILKSRQLGSDYVPLDTLATSATSYMDKKVIPGSNYYYKIRPILIPLPDIKPLVFTEIMGYKSFPENETPETPQGLKATSDKKGVKLSWKPNPELNLHGYYILRGTTKRNLKLVSGPIKDYTYTDTTMSKGYTGQYTYAIQVMDAAQNFSDTSSVTSIFVKSPRKITSPGGINARRSNDQVNIEWENTRIKDNSIIGYVLFRKEKGNEKYQVLNKEPIKLPSFTDSETDPLKSYKYVVSSIDSWGNQSAVSTTVEISPDIKGQLKPPLRFSLKNLNDGIKISWVEPRNINDKTYIIYRKIANENSYKKIGEVNPADTEFIDKRTSKGELYQYVISTSRKDLEGKKGKSEIIKRR